MRRIRKVQQRSVSLGVHPNLYNKLEMVRKNLEAVNGNKVTTIAASKYFADHVRIPKAKLFEYSKNAIKKRRSN